MPVLGEICPNCGKMVEHICSEKDRLMNSPFQTVQGGKPAVQKYFGDLIRAAILKVLIEYPHESIQSLSKGWELNEVILPQIMAGRDCLINNRLLNRVVDGLQICSGGLWDMIQAPDDKKTRILADIMHQLDLDEAVEKLMQPNPELARAVADLATVDLPIEQIERGPMSLDTFLNTIFNGPITQDNLANRLVLYFQKIHDRIHQAHSYFLAQIPRLPVLDLIKMAEEIKLITPEQAQDLVRGTEAVDQ